MNLIGDVRGKDVVVIDDMIDTAGTLIQAVEAVKREGARRILAAAVHGVLSGPAIERIEKSDIEEVIITNTVPLTPGEGQPEIPRAVGGAAGCGSHPPHPRRGVGVDSLRVTQE